MRQLPVKPLAPANITVSVIVRAKNEAAIIADALASIREQTVPVEIVLVDSGSTDSTLRLAEPYLDRLVTMPPSTFTFGRSLNLGATAASGEILFALSAHCVLTDREWIARSLVHFRSHSTAATYGAAIGPTGTPLGAPVSVTFEHLRIDPRWGFSNHASGWRREAWEAFKFDEAIRSCEDKEWMWRVLAGGWAVIADPALLVGTPHRRKAGLSALWRRVYWEHRAVAERLDYPVPPASAALRRWWSDFPIPSRHPKWQRRLSPWRNVEIVAGLLGEREGQAGRGPDTFSLPRHLGRGADESVRSTGREGGLAKDS